MAAQFLDADVEGNPRAQRWLLEDHGQRLALQRRVVDVGIGFQLRGHMQVVPDLLRREIPNG